MVLIILLDILYKYCQRWKLSVNTKKSYIMIFKKGCQLPNNLCFKYGSQTLSVVNKFSYLGIVFITGGSFREVQAPLSGQAQKGVYLFNRYLNKFQNITPNHVLELLDKLVSPILLYGTEVWGFATADKIDRVHLRFCKKQYWVLNNAHKTISL